MSGPDKSREAFEAWCETCDERSSWHAWQASRAAALEEAAKVCEAAIDRREAKRTEDRIRAAIATKETDDELRALRHATSVGLHNGALERAAAAIRELAGKTKEG